MMTNICIEIFLSFKFNVLVRLMLENVRQKWTVLEYFDAYICHHYQPKVENDDKYMQRNIPEL